jgi:hypothetical protein
MKKRQIEDKEPTIASGMSDHEELEKKATKEEMAHDDSTNVVTLSYDEVDPSEVEKE